MPPLSRSLPPRPRSVSREPAPRMRSLPAVPVIVLACSSPLRTRRGRAPRRGEQSTPSVGASLSRRLRRRAPATRESEPRVARRRELPSPPAAASVLARGSASSRSVRDQAAGVVTPTLDRGVEPLLGREGLGSTSTHPSMWRPDITSRHAPAARAQARRAARRSPTRHHRSSLATPTASLPSSTAHATAEHRLLGVPGARRRAATRTRPASCSSNATAYVGYRSPGVFVGYSETGTERSSAVWMMRDCSATWAAG